MRRLAVLAVALAFVAAAACTSDSSTQTATETASTFALQMGSSDLYAGTPQRVQLGVFNQTADGIQLLTGGSIPLSLAPAGGGETIEGTPPHGPAPGNPGARAPAPTAPPEGGGGYPPQHVPVPPPRGW